MNPVAPSEDRTRPANAACAVLNEVHPVPPHLAPVGEDRMPTRETLASLGPLAADQELPAIIRALAHPDPEVALLAESLLSRHPLFCLRKGPWAPPQNAMPWQRVFFPREQLDPIAAALTRTVAIAGTPVRRRLVENLARLVGLENVVDWSTLPLDEQERDYYENLVLCRDLSQFKSQLTVVLSYQCNKRCHYCFAEGLSQRLTYPITRAQFIRVLDWACRCGVCRVPVTGGEPTLHPDFQIFMAELRARNLTTCFSTNGCVPRGSFDCLSADLVETITFHVLDDEDYAPGDLARLEENIRCVKDKGIKLLFRYVLSRPDQRPWPRLFDLAARYQPAMLTFSPVFPGPYRTDMSSDVRAMFRARGDILLLAQTAASLQIRPVLAKPVPLCMFTRKEFLQLAAIATLNVCDIFQNHYTNNSVVNPDLALYPCMALPLTGAHLDSTPSLEQFGECSRRAVEPLQRTPMLAECPRCQLFQMRLCQPACLSFVLPLSPCTRAEAGAGKTRA